MCRPPNQRIDFTGRIRDFTDITIYISVDSRIKYRPLRGDSRISIKKKVHVTRKF